MLGDNARALVLGRDAETGTVTFHPAYLSFCGDWETQPSACDPVSHSDEGQGGDEDKLHEHGNYELVFANGRVGGDASDETLEADATVTAEEYEFTADNLGSGESEVVFDNAGEEPHHLLIAPLKGDATAEDVETFFKTEKGEPPISEEGGFDTAVIEGGEAQIINMDLEPGRYAFFCFISDRDGGPPHAFKGMINEIEVE